MHTVIQTERTESGRPQVLGVGKTKLAAQLAAVQALVKQRAWSASMASAIIERGLHGIVVVEGELAELGLMESVSFVAALREAEADIGEVEDDTDTYDALETAAYVAGKDVGRAELARELLAMLGLEARITQRERQQQLDAEAAMRGE